MTNQPSVVSLALITPGFSAHAADWAIPALQNLAQALAIEHRVTVFSQRYPANGSYTFNNISHQATGGGQKFGAGSLRIWLHSAWAIIRQHRQTPFDVLHAFWADEAGFSAALAGVIIKKPVVVSLGGGELTNLPAINYGAQRFLSRRLTTWLALQRADLITAGSNTQLELCQRHNAPRKLHLAPLGVDTQRFQPAQPRVDLPAPTVLQAASLLPVKNQTLLLQVAAKVKKIIPNLQLRLAGSGPEQDRLVKLAQQLDLSQNIVWAGALTYPHMPAFFRQGQLYLQTSLHESQGMALLEAMACGLPVLGTPVGVAKDMACLPPTFNEAELAEQVVTILSDKTRLEEQSWQARQIAAQSYSLEKTTQVFVDIYEGILTSNQPVMSDE